MALPPKPGLVRYAALLRGVSPMNATMPALKAAFEAAGFVDVKTVLASGNVVFSAPPSSVAAIERKAELALEQHMSRPFFTIVREVDALRALIEADPWRHLRFPPEAKRVVSFLRAPPAAKTKLPVERDGAQILAVRDREVFSAYVPGPKGPVFMVLIAKTFGDEITTRTWDTVKKLAK